jgi:hypothetical protein
MLIQDLFGFIRRNSKKWDIRQTQKFLVEINQIQRYLERLLKDKGVA